MSGTYLATVRFRQQGRRGQSRGSDVDFGDGRQASWPTPHAQTLLLVTNLKLPALPR